MNCSSLYRKKYDGNIFTTIPSQVLRDQNVSVGIGLIELTEPSDTLNYKPFFNHCILQTILHIFLLLIFLWNIIFCFKNWAVFYIFLILLEMVFSVTVLKILWFWFFLQGSFCSFNIKNKLKSQIFNDKKSLSPKMVFSVVTKN